MPLFYATFVPGLETAVERLIHEDMPGCKVEHMLSGGVQYRTRTDPKPQSWMGNQFLSLTTFSRAKGDPVKDMVNTTLTRGVDMDTLMNYLPPDASTYRALFMVEGTLVHASLNTMASAERFLTAATGLTPNHGKPDVEFWFVYRQEGIGFLLMRLTRHNRGQAVEGELRHDLASMLIRLCDPKPGMTFVDPLAYQSGFLRAAQEYPFETIIGIAPTAALAQTFSEKLNRNKTNVYTVSSFKEKESLPAGGANIAVCELSPRHSPDDLSIGEMCDTLAANARRMLIRGGVFALITTYKKEAEYSVSRAFDIRERYDIFVSGRKSAIFIAEKS